MNNSLICTVKHFYWHFTGNEMKKEVQKDYRHAGVPLWYRARLHCENLGSREMQLLGEFVEIEEDVNPFNESRCTNFEHRKIGTDEILFAKFLIAAMLFVSEPKMKSGNYAELLGVSRTSFFSHLKNASMEHPFDILTKLRICISKQLLAKTGRKVNEIAIDVGKENTGYFSLFFKRQTGETPLEFRKRCQSEASGLEREQLGVLEILMSDGRVWNVNIDRFAERLPVRKGSYLELIRGL